jgi:hypothetical protein
LGHTVVVVAHLPGGGWWWWWLLFVVTIMMTRVHFGGRFDVVVVVALSCGTAGPAAVSTTPIM